MIEKYAQITSLLKELDMYESQGFHKIADEILEKIKKVAKHFDPQQDLDYKGTDEYFQNLVARHACDIPECYEFFCGQQGGFVMTRDFTDLATEALKKPGTSITDVARQQQGMSDAVNKIMNLTNDKTDKMNKCVQKIHERSQNVGDSQNQSSNQEAQFRETPPTI
jgi:hypothetical protein